MCVLCKDLPAPSSLAEALQQRMDIYKSAAEGAKSKGDDRKARMHERIVKVHTMHLKYTVSEVAIFQRNNVQCILTAETKPNKALHVLTNAAICDESYISDSLLLVCLISLNNRSDSFILTGNTLCCLDCNYYYRSFHLPE